MIFNQFSITSLLLATVVLILGYSALHAFLLPRKLPTPHDSSAVLAKYTLPFGLDLMYQAFKHMRNHNLYEWTNEILNVPGRTVELNLLGSRLVLTDEPANVKTIMSTKFSDFNKGELTHKIFQNVLGDSIFTADGQSWLHSKDLLRPHVSRARPDDLEITERHFKRLLALLETDDGPLDITYLFDRYQLNVSMEIFLGCSSDSFDDARERFSIAVNTLLRINSIRQVFGSIALLFPDWLIAPQAYKDYNEYLDRLVSEYASVLHQENETVTPNLVQTLKFKNLTSKQIKSQLLAVLIAAKDPPSITMSWVIFELARHPEAIERLREEISRIVGFNVPPNATQLKQMTFLQSVIKETIRIYHPLGMNIREVKRNTSFPTGGGRSGRDPVYLLQGQRVAYSVLGLQRRPDIVGPDADKWKPTRWESWTPAHTEYIPFNIGPRICLGREHGFQQVQYLVARIFQEFVSIHNLNKTKPRIKVEMNTKPAEPILCTFEREDIKI